MHAQRKPHTALPGRVHIIGGRLRGSRLSVADLPGLRPTPQRLRQTLFDWLAPVIDGARVLDAFAGTGALGIEALSRGAREAVFFERDPGRARALVADLARLHQDGVSEVRTVDTLAALAGAPAQPFDVAFVDPPFDAGAWTATLALLAARGWLRPAAWVYVELGLDDAWQAPSDWVLHRQRDVAAVRGTLLRVPPAG
jgi:16S rRNA (guanine966-N2)-methyltransferase